MATSGKARAHALQADADDLAYVRRINDAAPPLSARQRERLAALFRPIVTRRAVRLVEEAAGERVAATAARRRRKAA